MVIDALLVMGLLLLNIIFWTIYVRLLHLSRLLNLPHQGFRLFCATSISVMSIGSVIELFHIL